MNMRRMISPILMLALVVQLWLACVPAARAQAAGPAAADTVEVEETEVPIMTQLGTTEYKGQTIAHVIYPTLPKYQPMQFKNAKERERYNRLVYNVKKVLPWAKLAKLTIVETYDNAVIYVPNSEFVSTRLINWTRNSRTVRRDVVVGVAYGSDTTLVMKLLASVANGHSDIRKYPAPVVLFSNFGASTLDFTLRFWVRDYDVSVKTASELLFEIDQLFRKNNIEIAFPQMDVHIKDMPPRARSPRDMATRPTAALPDSPADRRAPHGSARPQRPLRNRKPRPGGKLASRPRPAADDDTPTDEDRQLTA